jgi:hypothetical protein
MSELLWSQLPFVTQPNKDDELLLVNGEEQSRRITVQNLIYGQLLTLNYTTDGNSSAGIGTANAWGMVPFNQSSTGVTLNPDGSFVLSAGIYLFECFGRIAVSNASRFRLRDITDNVSLVVAGVYSNTNLYNSVPFLLRNKLDLLSNKTLGVEFNVSSASGEAFHRADSALAGVQIPLVQAFIWRLG